MTVPKLRFPEFWDAGEWEETKLGNIGEFTGGGTPSRSNGAYWDGNIPWISSSDISEESIYEINISRFITEKAVQESATKLVPENSILLISRVGVGKLAITVKSVCTSQDFTNFTPTKGNLIFLAYFLKLSKNNILLLNQGTSIKGFTKDDIANLKVGLPYIKEQQKIADCLSSIDDRITAETQKLDTLKAHKKGLMQQLFPAEGETLPKLRFSQFRDVGEWINTSLGKVSKITSGGTPSRSNKDFWKGNIPWVTTSLIDFNTIFNTNEYISEVGLKGSSAKLFPKNTILMAMYGQGKTRGKVAILGIEATTNQACAAILLNKELDINFVFQNLASRYDEIRELSNRGGQENLSAGLIEAIYFSYPIDKSEQQKIANCLSSLDELITAQTQKIDTIKTHKKGLMQQLFPALDEVVG